MSDGITTNARVIAGQFSADAANAPRRARATVATFGRLVAAQAKTNAPDRTGRLRNSISSDVEDTGSAIVAHIGPTEWYAGFVERGSVTSSDGQHHAQAPRPFLGPAADRYEAEFVHALEVLE